MPKQDTVDFDAWFAEEQKSMQEFREWWKKHQESDPAAFPRDMHYGDWCEQYNFFCEESAKPRKRA